MKRRYSTSNFLTSITGFFKANLAPDVDGEGLKNLLDDQFGHDWQSRLSSMIEDLTPEKVRSILLSAGPNAQGNLGQLYELFYRTTMDPRFGGMIEKRQESLVDSTWSVKVKDQNNSRSAQAAEFIEKWIDSVKFDSLMAACMDGKLYGVAAFQNVVKRSGDQYYFEDPVRHQIPHGRWGMGTGTESGKNRWGQLYLKYGSMNRNIGSSYSRRLYLDDPDDLVPGQISSFIYKEKTGYYDTTGILARVTKAYLIKYLATIFWLRDSETHGRPFLKATLSEKQYNDEEFKSIIKVLFDQFASRRWGIFPEGFQMDELKSDVKLSAELYRDLIAYANSEATISLMGQNLSTEVSGGSFAATTSHMKIEERKIRQDAAFVEEGLNDNQIYYLQALNFPDMNPDDFVTLSITPRIDINMAQESAGFKSASELIDVPVDDIYDRLQIRKPRPGTKPDSTDPSEKYDEKVVGPSSRRVNSIFSQLTSN